MKKKVFPLFSFFLLVVVLLIAVSPVSAASRTDAAAPPDFLDWLTNMLFVVLPTLIGVAALVTVVTNVLKTTGVIADGNATAWAAGLNLVGIVALILLKIFKPDWTFDFIDATAGKIANILMVLSAYVFQIVLSGKVHDALKGIPVIGKSYTLEKLKAASPNTDQITTE